MPSSLGQAWSILCKHIQDQQGSHIFNLLPVVLRDKVGLVLGRNEEQVSTSLVLPVKSLIAELYGGTISKGFPCMPSMQHHHNTWDVQHWTIIQPLMNPLIHCPHIKSTQNNDWKGRGVLDRNPLVCTYKDDLVSVMPYILIPAHVPTTVLWPFCKLMSYNVSYYSQWHIVKQGCFKSFQEDR